jgi:AdoMet-dependent rRNA methyltransferase SPB1
MYGVTCIQSDITSDKCRSIVRKELKGEKADVVLNDGAPNVGSNWAKDAYGQCELVLQATRIACEHLRQGGTYVTKVFRSADYNSLLWVFSQLFNKVDATKPQSSRNVSAEIFVMCIGFKAGKIDPRFFDPKWVFMETVEQDDAAIKGERSGYNQGAALNDLLKGREKKHRGGYEWGDDLKIIPAHEFIDSNKPAEILVNYHRISLEASGSEELAKHELTNDEIREHCADLKVLGKADLSALMKWRMRIIRGREKADRVSRKEKAVASKDAVVTSAISSSTSAKVGTKADAVIAQDMDDAIAEFLEAGERASNKKQKDNEDEEESEVDEELEKDLAEHLQKRRREERLEQKRTMARQRKMEWKKKLSLGGGKDQEMQEQPELFKVNKRNVEALEDEDKYVRPNVSDGEESAVTAVSESDSDDELDRIAQMEVDLAVGHELRKMRGEQKFREQEQKKRKAKKETRRQKVLAAWSGELTAFNESLDRQAAGLRDKAEADAEAEDNDSDVDEDDLKTLRRLQDSAENPGQRGASTVDGNALEALLDGGHPDAPQVEGAAVNVAEASAGEESESEPEGAATCARPPKALKGPGGAAAGAIVPFEDDDEDGEDALRNHRRASRWFSQDIFKNVGEKTSGPARKGKSEDRLVPLDKNSEDGSASESEDGAEMREFEDEELPQLPLTDKEKRRLKRKREQEKLERAGKKPKKREEDEPMEVAPLEAPKPLVTARPQKPSDPRELAETLALGSLLVNSKKSRMELIDAAYNRYAFDRDETLPEWFTEDENKHNTPELPVTKEMMAQFRAKLKEINARPIRKVAEAKARKSRRLKSRLDKLRTTAMGLAENGDMSESARARTMKKQMARLARTEERKVSVVAMSKGGGGRAKKQAPKGAKVKVVDRRMKNDLRHEKKAAKKNPWRAKQQQKKIAKKQAKNGRLRR